MKTPIDQNACADHVKIASVAFKLWEQAGRPSGLDLEFWLDAEQRVLAAQHAEADTAETSQSRPPKTTSSRSRISTSEAIGATRSISKGAKSPYGESDEQPTLAPAIRLGQARAKGTASVQA